MDMRKFVTDYTETCGIVEAKLHDFDINSSNLKPMHKIWLDEYVVPILFSGGSVSLVGEASRTGTRHYNQRLSEQRAKAVLAYLRTKCRVVRHVCSGELCEPTGVGESAARHEGLRDHTEDAFYRAVRTKAWLKPTPPPPVIKPDKPKKLVKRVSYRASYSYDLKSPFGSSAPGFELGKIAVGKPDRKGYVRVPREHVVIRVLDKYEMNTKTTPLGRETKTWQTIYYFWGPRTPDVVLHHKTYFNDKLNREYRESIPRAKIWNRVKAPDS